MMSGESWNMDCGEMKDSLGGLDKLVLPPACRESLEQIRETHKEMNGEELVKLLGKIDLSDQRNEVGTLVSLWLLDPHQRDAVTARNAFEHGDTNYKSLLEIYCGRKSSHILFIKQRYQTMFRRQLDQDIINAEPPSPYQRMLIAMAASHKSHHVDISQHIAKCDARRLYKTGEGRPGAIEESVVLEIFSKRSIPQLKITFSTYKRIYGHDYEKSLKKEVNGELGDAIRNVVQCLCNPAKHYAEILYSSIKGKIADKSASVRVIMDRAGIDMDDIQRVFKTKYGMELRDAIYEGVASGDCRDFLVALASMRSSY
ncbi:hypothetical protein IFM89_013511 [Coptis chinensis]|uniref:Annexin n=1 Tax=Coptis chinensis TaxID=261450 RepID=A0A835LF14_9MAGN|nr:hypothetical protein IFM89_013511 [Coptis chinensis]